MGTSESQIRGLGLGLASLLLVASVGCGPVVTEAGATDFGQGGDAPNPSPPVQPPSPDPPVPTPPQAPPIQANNIGGVKDDLLLVSIGNYLETCGPNAFYHYPDNVPPCTPVSSWQLELKLPLSGLQVGTVWAFPDISNGWSFSQADPATYQPQYGCGGGGGTYWEGTAEVLSVSDTEIGLRLAGTSPFFSPEGGNADGDYTITLCGRTPPPAQLLSSAVATTKGQALELVATNVPNTCATPIPYLPGCDTEVDSVSIDLPPAMQAVGTYPLTNIGTFTSDGADSYQQCEMGQGSYQDGTVEILSIDAAQVVFKLSGTATSFIAPGNADGTFVAPRCN